TKFSLVPSADGLLIGPAVEHQALRRSHERSQVQKRLRPKCPNFKAFKITAADRFSNLWPCPITVCHSGPPSHDMEMAAAIIDPVNIILADGACMGACVIASIAERASRPATFSSPSLPSEVPSGFPDNLQILVATLTRSEFLASKRRKAELWMNRTALVSACLLMLAAGFMLENACGQGDASGKIKHVVIIFQENRTPDNLFHDPVLMQRGADIASSGVNSLGQEIPLVPTSLSADYDLGHSHQAFESMYDGGKMDGADKVVVGCPKHPTTPCPPTKPAFRYVRPSEVQPYFQLAEQYTFADRMFQTNEGPSFPAHQFIISGTSAPTATSHSFMAENSAGIKNAFYDAGCISPPTEFVYLINPAGQELEKIYPCLEHPTLTDELNQRGIDWRYYTPSAGVIWTAPNAIEHMCGPNNPPPNATSCVGPDWVNHVVLDETRIFADIAGRHLPQVSWVIPNGYNSDHPSINTGGGPSWVAAVVNMIGNSQYWADTAIIITWDDWGGWYDHVPPFKIVNDGVSWGSGYVYGFRVPLIVVSPYARPQYISHQTHDFGSILKFVETVFNLPSLGYADAYAPDDLSDCFNLIQAPLKFTTIQAPLKAQDFLNDKRPKAPPDDD
ncbi:MAG TPA: alkaline phosphatase family protein, partial [Puia sp.]|nr:alkaline phosphatase family protein [Puia sp.]